MSLMGAAVLAGVPQTAHAFTPIATGDLIVSDEANNTVKEYTPSGTLVQTLINNIAIPAGSAFDAQGQSLCHGVPWKRHPAGGRDHGSRHRFLQ